MSKRGEREDERWKGRYVLNVEQEGLSLALVGLDATWIVDAAFDSAQHPCRGDPLCCFRILLPLFLCTRARKQHPLNGNKLSRCLSMR